MTAAYSPSPLPHGHHSADRRIMLAALAVAGVFHMLAMLLPMPRQALPLPAEERTPIELKRWRPAPPPMPETVRPRTEVPRERLVLVPVPTSIDLSPVATHEPPPSFSSEGAVDVPVLMPDVAAPPPPTAQGPYLHGEPGIDGPYALVRPEPVYPSAARQVRLEGRVVLAAVVSADGTVESVEVLRASEPDLGFSKAAIEAVSSWRYEPATRDGHPVAVSMTVVVDFRLH